MARSINSAHISFGLVTIPVKLYTASSSDDVHFSMITPDGNKVRQQYVDANTGEEVDRDACLKGFECAKGEYVTFTAAELASLQTSKSKIMSVAEFVSLSSVDLLQVEKSYYLGPDKGGAKGYLLLAKALKESRQAAVAQWAPRGKEQLMVIREYRGGLIIHQMFYSTEVRNFEEVLKDVSETVVSDIEVDMAKQLIKQLSKRKFSPEAYRDTYGDRVRDAVKAKVAGKDITTTSEAPAETVMDLMAAIKMSLQTPTP